MMKTSKIWFVAGAALILAGVGFFTMRDSATVEGTVPELQTSLVKEGPLWITLSEQGTINASNQVVLPSEVEGQTQVLWLVEESAQVEAGDLLVRLDSSRLEDELIDRQIMTQNAEADFITARENLGVLKNQAQSDVNKARLAVQFATEDLKKYIEGDYPNELKDAQATVTLAEADLATREDDLRGKERLYDDEFITATELATSKRRLQRAQVDLELAEASINLLKEFTYKRNVAQLESDFEESKKALERARLTASANVIQGEARLKAQEAKYAREQGKLAKVEEQIVKTKIYAPVAGRVVYATRTSGGRHGPPRQEPLEEGTMIRERQDVINLRTDNSVTVQITIHEANLGKVRPGLSVRITVDALPGREFTGRVSKVALLPDAQNFWMNPDLKVYGVNIDVDGDWAELRTGMSCNAEVVIERHDNTVFVPTESVLLIDGSPTVFVVKGSETEKRPIEVGLANERVIRVVANLSAGERILTMPPLDSAAVTLPSDFVESVEILTSAPSGPVSRVESDVSKRGPASVEERPEGRRENWRGRGQGRGNMTPGQREEIRKRFENMSPEDRAQMRERRRGDQHAPANASPGDQ